MVRGKKSHDFRLRLTHEGAWVDVERLFYMKRSGVF